MRKHFFATTLPLCTVMILAATWMISAGPLSPPSGLITSTGRFGPRIDVNTLSGDANSIHKITSAGSYYLSGNVQGAAGFHGIEIAANNVTLDLNGYRLLGVAGSLSGIASSGQRIQVTVSNGTIRDWDAHGVFLDGASLRVEDVMATGCGGWGINLVTFGHAVVDCQARDNGGLIASTGGIRVDGDGLVSGCISQGNTGTGFQTGTKSLVVDCLSTSQTTGVTAGTNSLLRGNMIGNVSSNVTTGCTLIDNRGI
ncbi:MAG: hypothetical protein AAF581_14825 [Planctomycetota bacterium]